MSLIKIQLEDTAYEIDPDRLTLGEARILKREYGMNTFGAFDVGDPDVLTGLLAIAILRATPDLTERQAGERAESIEFVELAEGFDSETPPVDVDPPSPGGNVSAPGRKPRKSATTPKSSGTRR